MSSHDSIPDLTLRAYFASVIGPTRAPYGQKTFVGILTGEVRELAQNSTRDRVLRVTVSRSIADILAGVTVAGIFSQQNNGAGSSDFAVSFAPASTFPFILYPGDILAYQSNGGVVQLVVAQETY